MSPDFLLVEKMKAGNGRAGEQFVRKHYPSIYQYCFLHIHNRDLAEDMTQETFLRFFEAIDTYTELGKTKNYLYSIAGNCMKNYYKKKKELLPGEMPDIPEENAGSMELRMDVERAVDRLPEDLKEVTILFFFQGLKQREIAELLNINLPLVKYRIREAKKKLSEYLGR